MSENDHNPAERSGKEFATTHWSMVVAAGDSQCPDSLEALSRLCRIYWLPVYSYIRRRGNDKTAAEESVSWT